MFPSWLTRLVLVMALAAFPLQGLAETLHLFLCQQSGAHSAAGTGEHGVHHQHGADQHANAAGTGAGHHHQGAGHHHDGATDALDAAQASDSVAGDGHAAHFCCDVVAAALPSQPMKLARFDFSALPAARDVFHETIFLEQPQRPPLG